jgi:hypothetical protein
MSSKITELLRSKESIVPILFFSSIIRLPKNSINEHPFSSVISCVIETYILKTLFNTFVVKEMKPYALVGILGLSAINIIYKIRNNMINKCILDENNPIPKYTSFTSPILSIILSLPINSPFRRRNDKLIKDKIDDIVRVSYDMHEILQNSNEYETSDILTNYYVCIRK